MAVYKVIQDIEAEDKLLGPLTLKGFIYAITAGVLAFLCVKIGISSVSIGIKLAAVFILFWPMLLFGVLASPLGREQPTEVWLLSHIRFWVKPKNRIWSQLGQVDLVTITAPKKVERQLIKDLTQTEVHSRLETLAATMDSRGWAIKNVYSNAKSTGATLAGAVHDQSKTDRLVSRSSSGQSPIADIHPSEDVLDLENSPRAQHVENLLQQKTTQLMEKRLAKLDEVRRESNISSPGIPEAEQEPGSKISSRHDSMPAQPKRHQSAEEAAQSAKNMSLSQGADTLSIESLSQLAKHKSGPQITMISPGEVEIKLH